MPDAELAAIVHGELQALVGAQDEPAWTAITRWTSRDSTIQSRSSRNGCSAVEDAEHALPGLCFCANYRGGVSVGDRIQTAHAMAETLARFLGAAT